MKWYGVVIIAIISIIVGHMFGRASIVVRCKHDNEFDFGKETFICAPSEIFKDLEPKEEKQSFKPISI